MKDFLLVVLSLPSVFDGEVELLEGLFEAGLGKLHLRKPGVDVEGLLERLAPRWASRLVLHDQRELAVRYGIPQVHGAVELRDGKRSGGGPFVGDVQGGGAAQSGAAGSGAAGSGVSMGVAVSTSVHSWEEFGVLPEGLAYAFISPLFDSISKKGYMANKELLRQPEEAGRLIGGGFAGRGFPCLPVGLGGIGVDTIGELLERGWAGAAVLGAIWDEPRLAVGRYEELKKIIDGY